MVSAFSHVIHGQPQAEILIPASVWISLISALAFDKLWGQRRQGLVHEMHALTNVDLSLKTVVGPGLLLSMLGLAIPALLLSFVEILLNFSREALTLAATSGFITFFGLREIYRHVRTVQKLEDLTQLLNIMGPARRTLSSAQASLGHLTAAHAPEEGIQRSAAFTRSLSYVNETSRSIRLAVESLMAGHAKGLTQGAKANLYKGALEDMVQGAQVLGEAARRLIDLMGRKSSLTGQYLLPDDQINSFLESTNFFLEDLLDLQLPFIAAGLSAIKSNLGDEQEAKLRKKIEDSRKSLLDLQREIANKLQNRSEARENVRKEVREKREEEKPSAILATETLSPSEPLTSTRLPLTSLSPRSEARQKVSEVLREVFPEPVRIVMEEFRALLAPVRLGVLLGKTALTIAVYQLLGTLGIETPLEEAEAAFNEQMTQFLASLEHLNRLSAPTPAAEEGNVVMSYYGEGIPDAASVVTDIIALGNRSELRHVLLVVAAPDEVEEFRSRLNDILRKKAGRTLSSFKNFALHGVPSVRNLLQRVHTLVSKANAPAAFVAQDEDTAQKAGYRRGFLRVSVDDPDSHTVALLLAAERLKKLTIDIITRGIQRAQDMIVGEWVRIAAELRHLRAFLVAA